MWGLGLLITLCVCALCWVVGGLVLVGKFVGCDLLMWCGLVMIVICGWLLCVSSDCLFDGLLSYGLVVVWFYSLGLRAIVVCI